MCWEICCPVESTVISAELLHNEIRQPSENGDEMKGKEWDGEIEAFVGGIKHGIITHADVFSADNPWSVAR